MAHEVNEAAHVLMPKMFLGRNPRRAEVCSAAADRRTAGLMYVTISEPTRCSRKALDPRLGVSSGLTGPANSTGLQFSAATYRTFRSLAPPKFYDQTLMQ